MSLLSGCELCDQKVVCFYTPGYTTTDRGRPTADRRLMTDDGRRPSVVCGPLSAVGGRLHGIVCIHLYGDFKRAQL